jgi:hypothetical protein
MEILLGLVSLALVMIPLWRIMQRTGRDPWLSLLFISPPIGTFAFFAILAFGRWPAANSSISSTPSPPHDTSAA